MLLLCGQSPSRAASTILCCWLHIYFNFIGILIKQMHLFFDCLLVNEALNIVTHIYLLWCPIINIEKCNCTSRNNKKNNWKAQ